MDMIDCINYFYSGLDLLEIWPLSLTKWTGSHLNVCSYFKFIAVKEIYFKYLCIKQILKEGEQHFAIELNALDLILQS